MAKDKDKIELKPEPKKSDKKSEAELSDKKDKKQSSKSKKRHVAATPVFIALAVLIIGVCAFMAYNYVNNKDSEEQTSTEEVELTYAEDLEQYRLYEGASQDERNTYNLRLAWAYYQEDNFERTLELLEQIQNPIDNISGSYNELYGLTLNKLGRDNDAQKYNQITLESREEDLLDAASESPVAYYSLGVLYANAGQTNKAIESYEKYITIFEGASEEGVYYEGSEYLEEARQALEELK